MYCWILKKGSGVYVLRTQLFVVGTEAVLQQ